MSREHYDIKIKCPNCGQEGEFRVSENDYAFMRKLDRDVTCISGDFETSMINDTKTKIKCKKCGHIFER